MSEDLKGFVDINKARKILYENFGYFAYSDSAIRNQLTRLGVEKKTKFTERGRGISKGLSVFYKKDDIIEKFSEYLKKKQTKGNI